MMATICPLNSFWSVQLTYCFSIEIHFTPEAQFDLFYIANNLNGNPYCTSKCSRGYNFIILLQYNAKSSFRVYFRFRRNPCLGGVWKTCGHACLQYFYMTEALLQRSRDFTSPPKHTHAHTHKHTVSHTCTPTPTNTQCHINVHPHPHTPA